MDRDNALAGLFYLAVFIFICWTGIMYLANMKADSHCLRAGWPEASVTWNFRAYCTKRVNQTDTVAMLRDIEHR